MTPLEVEEDFRLALLGFKGLSEPGRELIKEQVVRIIDFVSECEKRTSGEVPDLKLGKLDKQAGKRRVRKSEMPARNLTV